MRHWIGLNRKLENSPNYVIQVSAGASPSVLPISWNDVRFHANIIQNRAIGASTRHRVSIIRNG